jgi:hypothetical protein
MSSQANSLQDSTSKIIRAKWTAGVAQAVASLLCNCEALIPGPHHRATEPEVCQWVQSSLLTPSQVPTNKTSAIVLLLGEGQF